MQTEGKVITHSLPFDMGHARSFYSEKALDLSESNSPRRRSWWDVLSKSQPRESLYVVDGAISPILAKVSITRDLRHHAWRPVMGRCSYHQNSHGPVPKVCVP